MTYEAVVKKLKTAYGKRDASKVTEHLAIQFNIVGDGEGALYLEIADGTLYIEPYDYYDRDVLVIAPAKELIAIAEGKAELEEAIRSGVIKAEGNTQKLYLLNDVVPKTVKKTTTKKTTTKTAAKTTTKSATKTTAKKTTAKAAEASVEATVKAPAKKAATKKTTTKKAAETK